jgi:hypothetical protein
MRQRRLSINSLTKSLILIFILATTISLHAKEGMWIPATLLERQKNMKAMGLEIPVDDLYNEKGTSLNNAVVLFGRGCTGEVISSQGLVLTNHHCGYGSVQALSGPGNDYFASGYWAKNNSEELPCPGLTVTFIRRMENVTDKILFGLSGKMQDAMRDSIIAARISQVELEYVKSTGMEALIKAYFTGNQYWVAIMETYHDIRLVAFPPNSIGAFGGDVENWVWPRHTGDFSVFRVYAGDDNKPAEYAAHNKPMQANKFFTISTAGYKKNDFTMVYGFPGTTAEYISSFELRQVYDVTDPIAIEARTIRLDVWNKHMAASRDIFIKYTSKRAGVANGWKKWQGEVMGLKANNAVGKKQSKEKKFQRWANKHRADDSLTAELLPLIHKEAAHVDTLIYREQYNKEAVLSIELVQQAAMIERMTACFRLHLSDAALSDTLKKITAATAPFYKNYDASTDKEVFAKLMQLYFAKCAPWVPAYYQTAYSSHSKDFSAWAADVYNKSLLVSQDKLADFAKNAVAADSSKLMNDPAWLLYSAISTIRKTDILPTLKDYYTRMRYYNRLYMDAQMRMHQHQDFYPDANLTLRLSYGKISALKYGGHKADGFQTHLSDVIALEDTTNDIFKVPPKLKELYVQKDYGRWGVDGTMPVAFIASNHTSGGNSGSPVLNARGALIGTNFDRAYEGTMSDYYFDPGRCRNISVDIRYTLFIIDKLGGAGWLADEMNIVTK